MGDIYNEGAEIGQRKAETISFAQLAESGVQVAKSFVTIVNEFKAAFTKVAEVAIANLRSIVELYPQVEPVIDELAKRSCFLSCQFGPSELVAFAKLCPDSSLDDMETYVLAMYRGSFDQHVEGLVAKYPGRELFIRQASDAHRRGDFSLSILGFLSQADGICADGLKANLFFRSDDLRKDIKLRICQIMPEPVWQEIDIITPYRRLLLFPLSELQPIGYSEKKRQESGHTGLNRNKFLHGEVTDAEATEDNSLRAFSLLSYIYSVCQSVGFWDEVAAETVP